MRAALFQEHGSADVLAVADLPDPEPGPGEVLLEVRAVGLNHLDLWVRRGLPKPTPLPHVGGADIAGVVAGLGEGVEDWTPGDRVLVNPVLSCGRCRECSRGEHSLCAHFTMIGEHTRGGLADLAVVPAANLHRLPDALSFETAAALPVSYQTAWRALISRARLRPAEDVLVLGASGGTAIAAIQIARLLGARVFAVTSGPAHVEGVRALGADFVYDRNEVDFSREVFRDTDRRGVDVVVENVGEATWRQSLRSLARGGRLVTYGATTGPVGDTDLRLLFWKQLELIGSTMASQAEFSAMLRSAFRGAFIPVIDSTFPLSGIRAAHRRLESPTHFGKIVVTP